MRRWNIMGWRLLKGQRPCMRPSMMIQTLTSFMAVSWAMASIVALSLASGCILWSDHWAGSHPVAGHRGPGLQTPDPGSRATADDAARLSEAPSSQFQSNAQQHRRLSTHSQFHFNTAGPQHSFSQSYDQLPKGTLFYKRRQTRVTSE